MRDKRILVVWNGPETGTSANLFKEMCRVLEEQYTVFTGPNGIVAGSRLRKILHLLACELRRWPKIAASDAMVLHSYVALSFPSILLARLLRKRIILVLWDTYPITVADQRIGGRFRAVFDRMEHVAISLATRVVIPTSDFEPYVRHPDVRILPLWPSLPLRANRRRAPRRSGQPIRLAFVGQAAFTRGLPDAIERLSREAPTRFELHIFSPRPPELDPAARPENVEVVTRGYLSRGDLIAALGEMDFGLISLHPLMGQPGFPSKVFDYVAAGIPVIYTGRPLPAFEALLQRTGIGISLQGEPIDWEAVPQKAGATAVEAFAKETALSPEKLERAFF